MSHDETACRAHAVTTWRRGVSVHQDAAERARAAAELSKLKSGRVRQSVFNKKVAEELRSSLSTYITSCAVAQRRFTLTPSAGTSKNIQASCGSHFRDGRPLGQLIDAVVDGPEYPLKCRSLQLQAMRKGGALESLDHRRLWCSTAFFVLACLLLRCAIGDGQSTGSLWLSAHLLDGPRMGCSGRLAEFGW